MNKILIVDDNQPDRELLEQILSNAGAVYSIRQADSGRSALQIINEDPPDVILLDIQMSDINGFATLKELGKKKDFFIPVLLVSSFTGDNDRLKGIEMGASDFINKPIISEEVIARVAAHIKIKKMIDRAAWVAAETNEGIKVLYKELEKDAEKLKKLDVLKSNFVSTVSHELRTPLAIIRQGVSLIHRKILGQINDQQAQTLADVLENVDRLVRIINNILDISKLETGKVNLDKVEINCALVLQKLVEQFRMTAKTKDITIENDLAESLPAAFVDKDKFIQVVTNLLGNAVKFTPSSGRIRIFAKEDGDFLQIAVSDTGRGISKEDIPKLFEKFEQFGRKDGPGDQGTGLGLAISKEIVELHGGKIWIESVVDQGTTFTFTVPKYETPTAVCTRIINAHLEQIYAKKNDDKLSLVLVKFANFEQIKSLRGEAACQKVLADICHFAQDCVSDGDFVTKYSFDKVIIVLPNKDKAQATSIGAKIREMALSKVITYKEKHIEIKLQYSVATFPQDGMNANELLQFAQGALLCKKKILIVDDHPQVVQFLIYHLDAEKRFECISAVDGEQAFNKAIENIPDLIICDIAMPKVNGYQLTHRLKENKKTRDIPVIILTALNVDQQRTDEIILENYPLIAKTEGYEKIIETINQII